MRISDWSSDVCSSVLAVADALEAGRLGGYAADVFEMEDWARPDRPSGIAPRLLAEDARTVLTPPLGSAVARVRREIAPAAAQGILRFFEGRVSECPSQDATGEGRAIPQQPLKIRRAV